MLGVLKMETNMAFTPEFILSIVSIIFAAGSLFSVLKRLDTKMKENDKDLQNVITQQSIHNEKINKIDEKMNKVEIQIDSKMSKMENQIDTKMSKMEILNSEILKILTNAQMQNTQGKT